VPADPRATLAYADVLLVLLQSLVVCRAPVYKIGEWVAGREAGLLGLAEEEPAALNDDRLGRALDALFRADRASMPGPSACARRSPASRSCSRSCTTTQPHSRCKARTTRRLVTRPERHASASATRRSPDLAQLIWLLTISSDGTVPITYRHADGNTPEDPTHIDTSKFCCVLAGRTTFLYISDSKLCNRDAMGYIDHHHGRFLTIMPNTRAEVGEFLRYIATQSPLWTEVLRRPGKRIGDPEEVFFATCAPSPSSEISDRVDPLDREGASRRRGASARDREGACRDRRARLEAQRATLPVDEPRGGRGCREGRHRTGRRTAMGGRRSPPRRSWSTDSNDAGAPARTPPTCASKSSASLFES